MKIGCSLGKFSRFTILYNSSYSVYCFSIPLSYSSYKTICIFLSFELSIYNSTSWSFLQSTVFIVTISSSNSFLEKMWPPITSSVNQSVIFVATHINCNTQLIRMLTIAWTCLMTSSLPTSYTVYNVSYIHLACVIF